MQTSKDIRLEKEIDEILVTIGRDQREGNKYNINYSRDRHDRNRSRAVEEIEIVPGSPMEAGSNRGSVCDETALDFPIKKYISIGNSYICWGISCRRSNENWSNWILNNGL